MFKTILSFLFSASLTLSAQYTAIPDANFENYLEQNGMGDGVPGNGMVLTENIEDVTILELSMKQIAELTGIQDFTSLEVLDVSFNQLVTLDVSQNKNLNTLLCQANELITLTLDNPNLVNLIAFENFLISIDVSNSPFLEYFDINLNLMTTLDVSNNPLLTLIWCWGNLIEELDLSQSVNLEMINCSINQIPYLDLSNSENLVWVSAGAIPNLAYVDMRNGNNHNVVSFGTTGTNGLQCIFVDDASAPYLEDWNKDDFTQFVNNEQECDALSLTETEAGEMLMYPNPVYDKFIIKDARYHVSRVRIFDILGRLVLEKSFNQKTVELNLATLGKGLYHVQVETDGGTTERKKIIKQ